MTTYAFAGEFAGALLDGAGRPRRSVAVTVLKAGVPATLYTDRTKTAQASNPVSTDSRGNVRFFADPGDYTIDGSPITVPVDPAEAVGATVQPINFWPVGSEANMLALSAHAGDIAVRLDINRNFGLQGSDPSVLGNWVELADPGDAAAILRAVLLAKGDLVGASAAGSPARIQVGADGLPLVAASGDGTGVHYAQLATGGIADGAVTAAKVAADVATQAELDAEATARVAADALLIPIAQKGAANGVASLDSGSKVPAAQLPSITISDFLGTVANQAAMLALSGQRGDWAIRSDTSTTWMLIGDDATQLANWKQLATPADAVSSVNGRTGAVTGLAEATDLTAEAAARTAATALLLAKAANLSDVANAATARTNLGLGTAATAASTDFEAAGAVAAEAALRVTGDTTRVPNNQTADYTLVLADAGKVIEINAATGKNVTVPPNSVAAYPVNTIVWVQQLGAGAATAVAGAGVTLVGASLVTSGVGSGLLLRKTATNTWVVQATSSATSGSGGLPNVIQVASHATGGAGTAASPYTGWESTLATPASGTKFFFDGYFTTSQQLNFDLSQNIELCGVDGYLAQAPYTGGTMGTVGVPASQITFTTNNPASWISAKYSWGFRVTGMTLKNTSTGFTGVLADFGGTNPDITVGVRCENVNFDDSTNVGNSLACVSLDNNVESSFRQCAFYGAQYGVIGYRLGPWSNAVLIEQCRFIGSTKAPIKNPSIQWTIDSCIVEPMQGAPQATFIYADQTVTHLIVRGCFMWDGVAGAPVFKMTATNYTVSIVGNQLNSVAAAQPVFSGGTYQGFVFTGNTVDAGGQPGGVFYASNPTIANGLIAGNSVAISSPNVSDNAASLIAGGYVTKSLVIDTTGAQLQPINGVIQESVAGTTYTLIALDAGKVKRFTNAGAVTVTVPDAIFAAGDIVNLYAAGAGGVTLVAGSGLTAVRNNSAGLSQYGECSLRFDTTHEAVRVG